MDDYLDRACKHLGVNKGDVINPRIQGDDYVLLVDKGIAGCPKYYIPLSKLDALNVAGNVAENPVVNEPNGALDVAGNVAPLEGIKPPANEVSYRELQALAKEQGIPANQKADDLLAALWLDEEE